MHVLSLIALLGLPVFGRSARLVGDPIIDVGYAAFRGQAMPSDIDFFGGIRYVKAPLGDLRWRAPVALDERQLKKKNVTDARKFGDICIQQPAQVGFGTDDCLTLNIWKPSNAKAGDKLAVVLYIHGGGNYYASAKAFPMDKWVVASHGNVIAVNIQYRLGLLGFLASEAIMNDGAVNAGLLDQRAALAWVKRHIASFGGDPERITVVGESAGGADIIYQMIAYGGRGKSPFQAAIVQSIGTDPIPPPAEYEACFANVTATLGCPKNTTDTMACLRSAPLSSIVAAVNGKPSTCKFLPVIDGDFLQDYPSRLLAQGKFHQMPFIGGHCTDDGSIFVGAPSGITNTTAGFIAALRRRYTTLSDASAARAAELYSETNFPSTFERAKIAFGDTIFTCQDWFIANKLTTAGERSVFNYRWNTPDPVQLAAYPWKGVMHTADLFFLFNGTNSGPYPNVPSIFTPFNATEQALSTEALGYWTSFARSFNPSSHRPAGQRGASPFWAPSLNGRLVIQEGMRNTKMEARTAVYEARCRFWNEIGPEIGL